MDFAEDVEELLDILGPSIWVQQLGGWCTDEDLWPENFEELNFTDWFDIKISSMVIDFVEDGIEREEY
ncbi:MAG: hypothetical protein MJK18_10070 [Bdellovibrionales bacterium]|nr:hypothetical protein [Bdellovibrionales bacterium]